MPKLEFFYFDSCPYCQLVLRTLEKHKLKFDFCNIHENSSHLERLTKDTGRRTVPCLYVDNKPMHESADIVAWLEQNQSLLEKK